MSTINYHAGRVQMRAGSKRILEAALRQYEDQEYLQLRYTCNTSQLPAEIASQFVQLDKDEETIAFLNKSRINSGNICLQLLYTCVQILLSLFFSQTSINGLLEKGRMFVFSTKHLSLLLPSVSPALVLDIGSGDGHVTDKIRDSFGVKSIRVTEMSRVMQRILRKKKYQVLSVDKWHEEAVSYDLISCLNVLDRCDTPLSMLKQMHNKLSSGGHLLLTLVLPYQPFVESWASQAVPTEVLPLSEGACWEVGVGELWEKTLKPLGFELMAVSRLPYLCEGDLNQDYFSLDDVVFVLKKK